MALFKRKDKTTIAELEEYYSEENKRRRTGMAWFMAFLSLLITVLVIVGLFFAARWLYRTVTDDSSDTNTTSVRDRENSETALPSFDTDELGGVGVTFGNSSTDNPEDAVQGERTVARNTGVVSDEAASTTRDSSDNTASSDNGSAASSVAGASVESELPDTGAGAILAIAPITAGIVGYAASRKRQLR